MSEGWALVADARRAFANMVDDAGAERASEATLCGHWTVHQVTGHLVVFVEFSLPRFFLGMLRARFDYDTAADRMATAMAERPIGDLTAALRTKAAKSSPIPIFPAEMSAADVAIHTQDIRRPLGLPGALPDDLAATALEFLLTHKMASNLIDTQVLVDRRIEATDVDVAGGEGRLVRGPAEALLLALSGRPVGPSELDGDGVASLLSR